MKAAVIGHPISHSKSPLIHNYWMKRNNIEGTYEAIDIAPENFEEGIKKLIGQNYSGFNVTVPHKEKIISLCDEVDAIAKQIGAVNTVTIKDGKLFGTNTDAFGFIENLKEKCPDINGKKAFVIGAGGASRAVLQGLIEEGVASIKLTNRTIEKAQELQKIAPDKIDIVDWNDKSAALNDVDILVNATSLGMAGQSVLEINLEALPKNSVVNDIVYAPLMTDLLQAAQSRGNVIVTGIGMLFHQARPAFEAWTGILPDVTQELKTEVLS